MATTAGRRPFLFGPPERPRFGWHHPPVGASRACGVVVCNPIGDDAIRAHRALRHLAERLAAAGFAVLRFDFDGTGDSSGDEREPGRVRAWLDDVPLAIDALRARGLESPYLRAFVLARLNPLRSQRGATAPFERFAFGQAGRLGSREIGALCGAPANRPVA